jgi:large subunit ribosomal protein L9
MQVILLERIGRLGQMGDVVKVRDGYGRNFLLPQGKALRATKENLARFQKERKQLEATNLERKAEAEDMRELLKGLSFAVIRQAGDSGQLYGSVSTRDIAEAMKQGGFTIDRTQVLLDKPIKALGLHDVRVSLHPEVEIIVVINVARTMDEAERQLAGEDITRERDDDEFEAEQAAAAAEALFDQQDRANDRTAVRPIDDEDDEAPATLRKRIIR